MDGIREAVCVCVDQRFGLHIVEGHHPLIAVQVDSDPRGSDVDRQVGCRICSEDVLGPIPQTKEPVPIGGACRDFTLTVNRVACHSKVPVSLLSNLHLWMRTTLKCFQNQEN